MTDDDAQDRESALTRAATAADQATQAMRKAEVQNAQAFALVSIADSLYALALTLARGRPADAD
jgi:hypothetical protein